MKNNGTEKFDAMIDEILSCLQKIEHSVQRQGFQFRQIVHMHNNLVKRLDRVESRLDELGEIKKLVRKRKTKLVSMK